MNNACPECGAIYSVAEKDIGRRIACKRCATPLIVAEEGLRREAGEGGKIASDEEPLPSRREGGDDRDDESRDRPRAKRRNRDDDDEARSSRRGGLSGPKVGEMVAKLKGMGDLATWLYGIGLFFVVYSFFSPRIDDSKIASRQGYLDEQNQENAVLDRKDRLKNNDQLSDARKKEQKEFKEKTLDPAEDDVAFAKTGKLRSQWWNVILQMFGFIIISFGSLGFLATRQPPLQRIVGGVTLLLVLLQVIGGGAVLQVGLGGHPPR